MRLLLYPDQAGKGTATTHGDHMVCMYVDRPPKLTGGKRLRRGRLTLTRRSSDTPSKPREEKSQSD